MTKKVLIICAGGMSSSVLSKKTTEYFYKKGSDILVEFASAGEGQKSILSGKYDLYLVSPQIRMLYKKFEKAGEKAGKPVANIPPDAYVPTPAGIEKLERIILENLLK